MVLLSPNINILIVVPGGVVELHEELDEAESLDVHVVGIHLVSHGLGPAAADTEHHDGLEQEDDNIKLDRDIHHPPPAWWLYFISVQSPSSGSLRRHKSWQNRARVPV